MAKITPVLWKHKRNKEGFLPVYLRIADTDKTRYVSLLFPILSGYDTSTPRRLLNAISSQNALVNKYLKKIAKQAGVRCKLSFHISRHSFGDEHA